MTYEEDMKVDLETSIVDNEYGDRLVDYLEATIKKIIEFNEDEGGFLLKPNVREAIVKKLSSNVLDDIREELGDVIENPSDFVDDKAGDEQ